MPAGERNAYLMRFLRDNNFTNADEEWVVKESRRERTEDEEEEFHRTALVTQHAARELANKFNEEVEELGGGPGSALCAAVRALFA